MNNKVLSASKDGDIVSITITFSHDDTKLCIVKSCCRAGNEFEDINETIARMSSTFKNINKVDIVAEIYNDKPSQG